jgi:hypothetical protein
MTRTLHTLLYAIFPLFTVCNDLDDTIVVFFVLFVFVLCFLFYLSSSCVFCFICLRLVFYLSSSCVFCTRCCQFLWIVHSWLPLRFPFSCFFICFFAKIHSTGDIGDCVFRGKCFYEVEMITTINGSWQFWLPRFSTEEVMKWASEWLLFNAKWTGFQQ